MELYKERNADQKREKTNLFIGAVRRYAGRTKEQIALAYAFFLVRDKYEDMPDVSVVMSYAEDDINIKDFLEENLGEGFVEAYQNVYRKYNKNDFAEIFLKLVTDDERMGLRSGYCTTPDSVINLAKTVLEIKPKERVLDLGCGKGKFCFSANADTPTAIYRGVDYDASCFNYAQMIKKVTGSNVSFSCENIFTLCEQQEKYDKVFADLPFAANVNSQGGESEYRKELSKKDPAFLQDPHSQSYFSLSI